MLPSRGALNKQAVWFEVGHDEAMTESGICDDFGRPLQELYFSPSTGFEGGVETVSRQVHVQGGVENIQNNGISSHARKRRCGWDDEGGELGGSEMFGFETPQSGGRFQQAQGNESAVKRLRHDTNSGGLRDICENGEFMDIRDENAHANVDMGEIGEMVMEEEENYSNLSGGSQSMRVTSMACRFAECSEVLNPHDNASYSSQSQTDAKRAPRQTQRNLFDYTIQGSRGQGRIQAGSPLPEMPAAKQVAKCNSCNNLVTIIPPSSAAAMLSLSSSACAPAEAPNNGIMCHFCNRPVCTPSCSTPCAVCEYVFCNLCSTICYESQYDRVVCLDCKMSE